MRLRCCLLLTLLAAASSVPCRAAEGYWMLDQLDALDWPTMKQNGIVVDGAQIRRLAQAVVKIGGGTGSFVSADGLVLTNHHIAFGCITSNSTVDDDIVAHGFLAASRTEERSCRALELQLLEETRDVTAEIVKPDDAKNSDAYALSRTRDVRRNDVAKACEAGHPDRRCQVASFYSGAREQLQVYKLIRDVRLVHTPERALGAFGRSSDNFEWPRHVADYTFLRAYVAPDGTAKPYDAANVPYKPTVFLATTVRGYFETDPVFVLGFPGQTRRHVAAAEMEWLAKKSLTRSLARLRRTRQLLEKIAAADPAAALKLADQLASTSNTEKRQTGQLEGLQLGDLAVRRRDVDKQLGAYLAKNPQRFVGGGEILPGIEKLIKQQAALAAQEDVFSALRSSRALGWAYQLYERAVERALPDEQRHDGYFDRQAAQLALRVVESPQSLVPAAEEALLGAAIADALALPADQRIPAIDERVAKYSGTAAAKAQALAKTLVAGTKASDRETRRRWFEMDRSTLLAQNDSLLRFAADLQPQLRAFDDDRAHEIDAPLAALNRRYGEALLALNGRSFYPDANATLRFAWGAIRGYVPKPRGSRRGFATTIAGLVAASTDAGDYRISEEAMAQLAGARLPQLVDSQLGDTVVNFIATTDTHGGNSGSPAFDGRGRLLGIIFDGNYEGLAGNFVYDEGQNRALIVDIRFIFDLMLRVYGAEDLIREMKVPFADMPTE